MKNKCIRKWVSVFLASAIAMTGLPVPFAPVALKAAENTTVVLDTGDRTVNFNPDWKFILDSEGNMKADGIDYDDSAWENVSVPHDFSITQEQSNDYEAESGFFPGGTGWYRKTAVFPSSYAGKTIVLNFDSVYNNAYVYINGEKVGEHHYGYTDFSFDITDLVSCDGKTENVIAVKAVNEFPSSRWYSGSGIYRDVTLVVTDPVHVAKNGTYVTTPDLAEQKDGAVDVQIETTVQNDKGSDTAASVRTTIEDADGRVVSDAVGQDNVSVPAGGTASVSQTLTVTRPELWDCENPNLYYVKTEILSGGKVVDTYETEFGFRYIGYDGATGFQLNGQNVKLKGVCMHHDQGALGAASYRDAVYRQVRILKEMGCNSIRSSHNAPGRVLIDVCNELGMLLMDEAFDGWAYAKNGNTCDFSKYFNQTLGEENQLLGGSADKKWYQFTLESLIERDKNDPCVIMWSIGNEINFGVPNTTAEPWISEYRGYAADMISRIKAIDPTKPITHGDNVANLSSTGDLRTQISGMLAEAGGVVGLNYSPGNYANNHRLHPTWPLVGSETASAINSRGIYSSTAKITDSANGRFLYPAYDTTNVTWGQRARAAWLPVISNDFVAGTYIWTGFDYIGEPTDWNGIGPGSVSKHEKPIPNSSFFGIIDTAGFPKDSFYFYTSQWKEDETTLHLVPGCWNRESLAVNGSGFVPVHIYSNAAKVELLLNDEVIGTAERQSFTTEAGYEYGMFRTNSEDTSVCTGANSASNTDSNNMAAQFNVKYEEGTLSVRAYDENDREITDTIGTNYVTTNVDEGSELKVTPERTEITADGQSLAYISVEVLDANGEFASQADDNIRFTLSGYGEIVGVDNGNQSTVDKFQNKTVLQDANNANIDAFSGKALVIVRSTRDAGGFSLEVEADGMETQTVSVETVGEGAGGTYLKSYDLKRDYTVDMGTKPVFQTTVNGIRNDGVKATASVVWDAVPESIYNTPGVYRISGRLIFEGKSTNVVAFLTVNPIIVAMKDLSKATPAGIAPSLPETVSGILPDGRLYGDYPVVWETVPASAYAKAGVIVTVKGTATLSSGAKMPAKMTVRVAEVISSDPKNVAPDYASLTETSYPVSDNLFSIVDGEKNLANSQGGGDAKNRRWTNWDSALLNSSPAIDFVWEEVQELSSVILYYYTDGSVKLPESVVFYASADGKEFHEVEVTASEIDTENNNKATYTFERSQQAKAFRMVLTQLPGAGANVNYVGLIECEIYDTGISFQKNNTAVLDTLTVNGKPVTGFAAGNFNAGGYAMEIDTRLSQTVVAAAAKDNASVTVLPIDGGGVARVLVQSENGAVSNMYVIRLRSLEDEAIARLKAELAAAVNEAAGKASGDFTADSWAQLQAALSAAQTVNANQDASSAQLTAAVTNLKAALAGLKAAAPATPPAPAYPKVGTTHKIKKASYKITASSAKGCTVAFVKPASKNNTKFTVPATVAIDGITYKVTEIQKNAFKNNKKLTSVTIGKNVTTIGASAFEGASKLNKITINSKGLKKVGKKALKGIKPKATIKVPKGKVKKYKGILKGKGQKSSVKIK